MGVFSNNRTSLGYYDIPVAEGYSNSYAADVMLVEAVQTDMALFEAMIGNDFAEVTAVQEGAGLEAIMEGALENAFNKVKELLKKIIAKLKALFAGFLANFRNVVIRDNKEFAQKMKHVVDNARAGSHYSKMKYKWSDLKGDLSPIEVNADTSLKDAHGIAGGPSNASTTVSGCKFMGEDVKVDPADIEALEKAVAKLGESDTIEALRGKAIGGGSYTADEFAKEYHEQMFDDEEEKDDKADVRIREAYEFLMKDANVSKMEKAHKQNIKTFTDELNKWEKKEKELGKKEGVGKDTANRYNYLLASYCSKGYNLVNTVIAEIHKAHVNALKFHIKQCRGILVKAASYTPKKEDAMLMNEAAMAEEYIVDTLFMY